MRNLIQAVFAVLVVTSPVAAQDFFQSFEDFVEEMLPERQAPRPAPRIAPREPIDANTPTPVEQRPDDADASVEENGPVAPPPRPRPVVAPEPEPVAEEDAPERMYQTACPALLEGRVIGEMLDPVAEGICGVRSPLSLTGVRVNGREIGFTEPVTTNCQMAGAIADWVGEVDLYASAALDSPLASVTTGTSLMCRNRNGAADGFVSEHGFANALDVVGFTLENDQSIAVEADWLPAAAPAGRLLRQAHGAACGRFTTVLGPEANAEHEDHFHLDLGCHGQSCTAQICE